jgi:predicted ester cyclase
VEIAHAYLRAWNNHDGAAVTGLFAPNGTYVDPTVSSPLSGDAIATYVVGLVTALPGLAFVIEGTSVDVDRVTLQWRLQGTNTGPFPGGVQPTGGRCDLPGVDVITVGPQGITSVVGYFDQKTFVEQLGLQVQLVPQDHGPLHWGTSARTDLANVTVPGALTMTWIDDRDEEGSEVGLRVMSIIEELSSEPGFIGWVGASSGHRGHTLTAWTTPQAAEAAIGRMALHREAMERFLKQGLGVNAFTSFWIPYRMNNQLVLRGM